VIVAAFDFDGTLTYRDSLFPFLRYSSSPALFVGNLARSLPTLCHFVLGKLENQAAKERVLSIFLAGKPIDELNRQGAEFCQKKISRLLRPIAMERLRWHKEQGHYCVLVSASLETYLQFWADDNGFNELICSRLETDVEGCVTGRLQGRNCHGAEKIRRLYEAIDHSGISELYAYGDSRGDRELLDAADHAFYRRFTE
jgi:phosphatidylglycerophosphatase C